MNVFIENISNLRKFERKFTKMLPTLIDLIEEPLKYSLAQRHGTSFCTLRSRPKRDERPDENGSLLLEWAIEIAVAVSKCQEH